MESIERSFRYVVVTTVCFESFTAPPPPPPPAKKCDWPRGTCTYYKDPCPPNWERCPQYDSGCPLATNHCCCRKNVQTVPQLPLLKMIQEGGDGNEFIVSF